MKRITLTGAAVISALLMVGVVSAQVSLEEGFRLPPPEARPHTWWHWMNGNVAREGITADLEAMKRIGLGGAQIFNVSEGIPEGPIAYNSAEWRELVKFAASEANRLGLELCIHNCAGWSSSGGPWVTPEHAMRTVVTSEFRAGAGTTFRQAPPPRKATDDFRTIAVLAFPTPRDDAARIADVRVKAMYESRYGQQPAIVATPADAVVRRDSIVDLTSRIGADGSLTWEAPGVPGAAGEDTRKPEWTVLWIGHATTGAVNAPSPVSGRGLEVDKMSRAAFDAYWAGGMAPLLKELGPLAGTTLRNCLVDSYEVGSQNWTPEFRAEFTRRRGYDPLLYLPAMTGRTIESSEVSERFLWDLRRTVGDLFSDHYFSYFAEVCRRNGLLSSVEPYDGPFECTQVGRDADIVMGEFWTNGGMSSSCKLAASVAHVYGKAIVGAESFTAFPEVGKWTNHPASLKAVGDLMYSSGINRYIIHRYAHQPWTNVEPGMTMGQWGTHFERTTTWWEQGAAWITYLARCQFMLQQGRFEADVCFFGGEASPGTPPFETGLKAKGYDYDQCGSDVILSRMSVRDGTIVLPDGMRYRVLVLPDTPYMRPVLLRKLRDLVREGATVIGPRPVRSPSLQDQPGADAEVAALAAEVWGDCDGVTTTSHAFGAGQVVWGRSPDDVLASMQVGPDCTFAPAGGEGGRPAAAWIHRVVGDADVYFVSNQKPRTAEIECSFRVSGKAPRLWHADTGRIEPAAVWSESQGRTIVPIQFGPSGSVFVVFGGDVGAGRLARVQPPVDPSEQRRVPRIGIVKAVYEAVDGAGGAEVTAKVAALVEAGETVIPATNSVFGDPTYNHVKRLRVDFTLDGQPFSATAPENDRVVLVDTAGPDIPAAYAVQVTAAGEPELHAFKNGTYVITHADGKASELNVTAVPPPVDVVGPWTVQFQRGRGAPDGPVLIGALESWSQSSIPGVKYFSGTGEYVASFEVPASIPGADRVMRLDLGSVREIAQVTLNGRDLGVWWKPPFEADVTDLLKPGINTLSVRVTNLWVNRLIGDEQFPDDCEWNGITIRQWPSWFAPASDAPLRERPTKQRLTFTTWKHWHKDSPLPDSGLIGPVRVRVGIRQLVGESARLK